MSLDFLKKPEVNEIVNSTYSDSQLKRARDYISNYKGEDLHGDFLRDIDFNITPSNREEYWKIYYATSPLPQQETRSALIKDIDSTVDSYSDPLEALMFLRDGAGTWPDDILEHYGPRISRYDDFFTADTLHKSTVTYTKDLQNRLLNFFNNTDQDLDPMVSDRETEESFMVIERNNLWDFASLDNNGRLGITSRSGDWIPANLVEDTISEYEEFSIPAVEEQLAISDISHKIIRQAVNPNLGMSRDKLLQERKETNDRMYDSLKSGLIGKSDAPPIIVNQIQQSYQHLGEIMRDSMKGLFEQDIQHYEDPKDILRSSGQIIGKVLNMLYIRGGL